MKLIICDDYNGVSKAAADIVAKEVNTNPECVLGLATGSTPVGMYEILADMNKAGKVDFKKVKSFNLDEYYPLSAENDQSYHYFMNENFFSKINIDKNNTHILNGMCENAEKECEQFEQLIEETGGIDLQILGIGQNGHIGFNEPNDNLCSLTHLTDLTENTIDANSRFFKSIDDVPKQALTMGIGTILKARKIIIMACGANKHDAVRALLSGLISTDMPASMLNVHTDVTLICDKEAYSNDCIGIDLGGTEIKFGVLSSDKKLVYKDSIPTDNSSEEKIVSGIANKCKEIMKKYTVSGIGVGTPGIIRNGRVTASNLPFKDTNLKEKLETAVGLPVRVSNDANCAALGEVICGAGQHIENMVMISLGTGVGGGIIAGNKIYEGTGCAGEFGHIVIEIGGRQCPCGQLGCLEQYASASALVNAAKSAAEANTDSILNKLYTEKRKMDGRIFFDAVERGCSVAKAVLDEYINYLAIGIKNIYNILDPELIVLSGGITNSDKLLLDPLKRVLGDNIKVTISKLKSDAGTIGAALLV